MNPLQSTLRKIRKSTIVRQDWKTLLNVFVWFLCTSVKFITLGIKLDFSCSEWPHEGQVLPVYIIYWGFSQRKRDFVYGMGAKKKLGKKYTGNAFLLFVIILINFLHLIRAIARAHASTHTTDLTRVKNSRHHFYFWQFQIKIDANQ